MPRGRLWVFALASLVAFWFSVPAANAASIAGVSGRLAADYRPLLDNNVVNVGHRGGGRGASRIWWPRGGARGYGGPRTGAYGGPRTRSYRRPGTRPYPGARNRTASPRGTPSNIKRYRGAPRKAARSGGPRRVSRGQRPRTRQYQSARSEPRHPYRRGGPRRDRARKYARNNGRGYRRGQRRGRGYKSYSHYKKHCRHRCGRHRHRRKHYHYYYDGWWYSWPWWSILLYAYDYGGYYADGYDDYELHVAYCLGKYKSYVVETDTYTAYSGRVRRCRSPYSG